MLKERINLAINVDEAIKRGRDLKSQGITYSMYGSRDGSDGSADCSGFIYNCIRFGGGSKYHIIPSTETLHDYLGKNGYKLVAENKKFNGKKGDIVIAGKKGQSAGAGGHVGMLLGGPNWIECTANSRAGKNGGVIESHFDTRYVEMGRPYYYVYRPNSTTDKAPKKEEKKSAPKKKSSGKVAVDGKWGSDFTKTLQKVYGTTQDGVISGQIKNSANKNVYAAQWGKGGSNVVKAMQKNVKAKGVYSGSIDGNIGPKFVDGMQRIAGTSNDGVISPVSNVVKYMQKQVNAGKKPF